MDSQTWKKFAAFLFAALLLAAVINAGCGGSSSLSTTTGINTLIRGAWRASTAHNNTASVDINGTEINLTVRDFAVLVESADIESSDGTVYL